MTMIHGSEADAGEMKKQKLKKNKMPEMQQVSDSIPVPAPVFDDDEEPQYPESSPDSEPEFEEVEAVKEVEEPIQRTVIMAESEVSSSGRSEARENRWRERNTKVNEWPTWQPTLEKKEGPKHVDKSWSTAEDRSWSTVQERSWSTAQADNTWERPTYRENYGQRYQSYSSYSYQGQPDSTSSWKSSTSTSGAANWSQNGWWDRSYNESEFDRNRTVRVTKEGNLLINLSNQKLDEEGMRRFCAWLPKHMRRLRSEDKPLTKRQDCFLAKELDASKNCINAAALKMLLTVLKEQRIVLGILNLHHNKLNRSAAGMLAMWIRTAPWALYELHLSHNEIDTAGALEIIEAVAKAERYPTDRPGSQMRIPLWLRMEHNLIEESFVHQSEEAFRIHRADDGPHVCWLDGYTCKSAECAKAVGNKCPVVHLPYVRQRFAKTREASGWETWTWQMKGAERPHPEVPRRLERPVERPIERPVEPPWVEVDRPVTSPVAEGEPAETAEPGLQEEEGKACQEPEDTAILKEMHLEAALSEPTELVATNIQPLHDEDVEPPEAQGVELLQEMKPLELSSVVPDVPVEVADVPEVNPPQEVAADVVDAAAGGAEVCEAATAALEPLEEETKPSEQPSCHEPGASVDHAEPEAAEAETQDAAEIAEEWPHQVAEDPAEVAEYEAEYGETLEEEDGSEARGSEAKVEEEAPSSSPDSPHSLERTAEVSSHSQADGAVELEPTVEPKPVLESVPPEEPVAETAEAAVLRPTSPDSEKDIQHF